MGDPLTVREALGTVDAKHWKAAMRDEYQSLLENNTWELVDAPAHRKIIDNKWVFKIKRDTDGKIVRHKARLVVRGFAQKRGIDYDETYAPVVRHTSIRYILAIAAKYVLDIQQMDAITAFLQGELSESIYMIQPECFHDGTTRVCRLKKIVIRPQADKPCVEQQIERCAHTIWVVKVKCRPMHLSSREGWHYTNHRCICR